MKSFNGFILIILLAASAMISCTKEEDPQRPELVYTSLTATPTHIRPAEYSTIDCVASGDSLTYEWWVEPTAFVNGSGPQVQFSICHADTFTIYCRVKDRYSASMTKSVAIIVQ